MNEEEPRASGSSKPRMVRVDAKSPRGRLETSYLRHLAIFRDILSNFVPGQADDFVALIQACPDMRIPYGRVGLIVGASTITVKAWSKSGSLPGPEDQEEVIRLLLREADARFVRLKTLYDPEEKRDK